MSYYIQDRSLLREKGEADDVTCPRSAARGTGGTGAENRHLQWQNKQTAYFVLSFPLTGLTSHTEHPWDARRETGERRSGDG